MLDGSTSDLQKYVNQQVQITGRLDNSSSNSASSGGTTGGTTATTAGGTGAASGTSGSMGQRLHVESVRMIASTCSSR